MVSEMTPGQKLTFACEGTYRQCKKPHVPSENSGITLDGGCDLAMKSQSTILGLLIGIDVPYNMALLFSEGNGLRGQAAKNYLLDEGLDDFELTPEQHDKLFLKVYGKIEARARRLYSKDGCRKAYGWIRTWDNLLQPIREMITDLTFRGDWTPKTRQWLAEAVKSNNLEVFTGAMSSWQYWRVRRGVPKDRFRRRVAFLKGG